MFARFRKLPIRGAWSYEVKWDGFRAIVSTEGPLRVRSRRGWKMTSRRVHAAPKGTDPSPAAFPLQTGHFRGPPEGAMIAIMDPGKADAVMVRERHAPVVAVLLAAAKKRARRAHPRTPRAKSAASRLLLQIRHFQGHRNGCHDPDDGTPDHPIRAPAHMPRVAGP